MKSGLLKGSIGIAAAIAAVLVFAGCFDGGSSGSGGSTKNDEPFELDRTEAIGGIDKNNNGIRDDIEAYIEKTYAGEKEKRAALQAASAFQEILLVDKNDKEKAHKAGMKLTDAVSCAVDLAYDENLTSMRNLTSEFEALTMNTKARLKAYAEFSHAINGMAFSLPNGNSCK